MSEIIIKIKNNRKVPFFKQLLKQFDFVEVVKSEPPKDKIKQARLLKVLDEAVDFVNNFKKNSTKAKTFNQLLREL